MVIVFFLYIKTISDGMVIDFFLYIKTLSDGMVIDFFLYIKTLSDGMVIDFFLYIKTLSDGMIIDFLMFTSRPSPMEWSLIFLCLHQGPLRWNDEKQHLHSFCSLTSQPNPHGHTFPQFIPAFSILISHHPIPIPPHSTRTPYQHTNITQSSSSFTYTIIHHPRATDVAKHPNSFPITTQHKSKTENSEKEIKPSTFLVEVGVAGGVSAWSRRGGELSVLIGYEVVWP
ncbi:hypothetical protein DEO72_LG5g2674 [Vigna unguiculata]|uniref:Uncharacterized protein n=1 Tax=Vigna unguiculata TaxID=3917 RepID=A0A4D6M005_VIGUN|nr:hypothetical protein DEO72_LG5g2674 [Vigna unguiculata]